jgi:(p)ppGpp synthase/HD superfamily hydrolase
VNEIEALARAYNFGAEKHAGQSRKGEAGEPYVNHLTEVAQLVAQATAGSDVDLVIAAVLHDTVEDTKTTLDELTAAFGPRVASLVGEVTDDKSLEKAERKRLQIEHAGHASTGAKIIKIADKTSNLRALATSPPKGWPEERKAEYLGWALQVVARCRGVNPWLEGEFDGAAGALQKG